MSEGPPPSAIDRLLDEARAQIGHRLSAAELDEALSDGTTLVVDTRPLEQRQRDGELPGAKVIDRNVLEWRLDPTCPYRIPEMDSPDRPVVIVCNEGYSSSLAAATLRHLGLRNVVDLDGGFQAWLRDRAAAGPATS